MLDGYVVSRGSVRPESNLERDVIINRDAHEVYQWKDKESPQADEHNDAHPPDILFSIHFVPTKWLPTRLRQAGPTMFDCQRAGDPGLACSSLGL